MKVLTLAGALSAAGPVLQETGVPVYAEARALSGSDKLVIHWWRFRVCTNHPCQADAHYCCGSVGF